MAKSRTPTVSTEPHTPIVLKLATGRTDKGQTQNYRVYTWGGQFETQNGKGETVRKNALQGGHGSIYLAIPLSQGIDEWVLVPKAAWDTLQQRATQEKKKGAKR